jgi:hypothetical protein
MTVDGGSHNSAASFTSGNPFDFKTSKSAFGEYAFSILYSFFYEYTLYSSTKYSDPSVAITVPGGTHIG